MPQVAAMLEDAGPDILAYTGFPVAHWQKLWSNNPLEWLNKEIRRRTDVVGASSPTVRPLGALWGRSWPSSTTSWAEARHYLTIPSGLGIDALPEPRVLQAAD